MNNTAPGFNPGSHAPTAINSLPIPEVVRSDLLTGKPLPIRDIGFLPFKRFWGAVAEASRNMATPYDMSMLVALSIVSLAVQGLAVIEKPRGGVSPLSLLIMILSGSGTRKSPLVKLFYSCLIQLQNEMKAEYKQELAQYKKSMAVWDQKEKAFGSKLRKLIRDGECSDGATMKYELHLEQKPIAPMRPKFLYEDVTGPGLWKAMADGFPSAGVVSSEGSASLSKWLKQDLCHFNTASDGDGIDILRAEDGNIEVEAILSLFLLLQPSLFDKHLEGRGKDLRELGTFARFLFCRPESIAGDRPDDGRPQSWMYLEPFKERIVWLMKLAYERLSKGEKRKTYRFDQKAVEYWFQLANKIEQNMAPGGYYEGAKDHASKIMDIISRVAACLHIFESYRGNEISLKTLEAAAEICFYFSDYYVSQFSTQPQQVLDAIELEKHINNTVRLKGVRFVKRNHVRNTVPKQELRKVSRFEPALYHLFTEGKLREMRQKVDGHKESIWLDLLPQEPFIQPCPGHWYYSQ